MRSRALIPVLALAVLFVGAALAGVALFVSSRTLPPTPVANERGEPGPGYADSVHEEPKVQVHEEGVTLELPFVPAGLPVRLTLYSPAGPVYGETVGTGRGLRLTLPYLRAGRTPYRLAVGRSVFSGELARPPGPPVTLLSLKVGARALRVTEAERSALVLHPLDAQGNVSEASVEVTVLGPGGERWEERLEVEGLLAWTWLPRGESPGTLWVSAVSGEARGERAEVDLLPGFAAGGRFEGQVTEAPATGRDPWRLEFGDITDARGHPVADGSALHLLGQGAGRDFFFTRPAVRGGTELVLPAYPWPGSYTLEGRAGLFRSDPIQARATPAFAQRSVPLTWLEARPQALHIGPLWSPEGALPDDGTPVLVQLMTETGEELHREEIGLLEGRAVWTPVATPLGARVRVSVAGLVSDIALREAP